jgi:hypothetical protein
MVIVDAGRLRPASPAMPLIAAAQVVLVVLAPTLEAFSAAGDPSSAMQTLPACLVLVGQGRVDRAALGAATGLEVLAQLPRARSGRARKHLADELTRLAARLAGAFAAESPRTGALIAGSA